MTLHERKGDVVFDTDEFHGERGHRLADPRPEGGDPGNVGVIGGLAAMAQNDLAQLPGGYARLI